MLIDSLMTVKSIFLLQVVVQGKFLMTCAVTIMESLQGVITDNNKICVTVGDAPSSVCQSDI